MGDGRQDFVEKESAIGAVIGVTLAPAIVLGLGRTVFQEALASATQNEKQRYARFSSATDAIALLATVLLLLGWSQWVGSTMVSILCPLPRFMEQLRLVTFSIVAQSVYLISSMICIAIVTWLK